MHIIVTLFIGLIVGLIAKLLMPGRDPGGFIITALLGIAGSFRGKIYWATTRLVSPRRCRRFFGIRHRGHDPALRLSVTVPPESGRSPLIRNIPGRAFNRAPSGCFP